jgi:hypothetical protein
MKTVFFFALVSLLSATASFAEGEATALPQVKGPGETVEVAPESSTGLFERVREAHIRAVQKGTISATRS